MPYRGPKDYITDVNVLLDNALDGPKGQKAIAYLEDAFIKGSAENIYPEEGFDTFLYSLDRPKGETDSIEYYLRNCFSIPTKPEVGENPDSVVPAYKLKVLSSSYWSSILRMLIIRKCMNRGTFIKLLEDIAKDVYTKGYGQDRRAKRNGLRINWYRHEVVEDDSFSARLNRGEI